MSQHRPGWLLLRLPTRPADRGAEPEQRTPISDLPGVERRAALPNPTGQAEVLGEGTVEIQFKAAGMFDQVAAVVDGRDDGQALGKVAHAVQLMSEIAARVCIDIEVHVADQCQRKDEPTSTVEFADELFLAVAVTFKVEGE